MGKLEVSGSANITGTLSANNANLTVKGGTIGNISNKDTYTYQGVEYQIGQSRKCFIQGIGLDKGEEKEKRIQELNDMGMVWVKHVHHKRKHSTTSGEGLEV